jgi:hypothetical protein
MLAQPGPVASRAPTAAPPAAAAPRPTRPGCARRRAGIEDHPAERERILFVLAIFFFVFREARWWSSEASA